MILMRLYRQCFLMHKFFVYQKNRNHYSPPYFPFQGGSSEEITRLVVFIIWSFYCFVVIIITVSIYYFFVSLLLLLLLLLFLLSEVLSPKSQPIKLSLQAERYFNSNTQAALWRMLSDWASVQKSSVG